MAGLAEKPVSLKMGPTARQILFCLLIGFFIGGLYANRSSKLYRKFCHQVSFSWQNEDSKTCRLFIIVSLFCHGSMPRKNTKCFCGVAEASFFSWRQKLTLQTTLSVWQNWETCARHECFWKPVSLLYQVF